MQSVCFFNANIIVCSYELLNQSQCRSYRLKRVDFVKTYVMYEQVNNTLLGMVSESDRRTGNQAAVEYFLPQIYQNLHSVIGKIEGNVVKDISFIKLKLNPFKFQFRCFTQ